MSSTIIVPDNSDVDIAGQKALEKWLKELDIYKIMKTGTAKDLGEMQIKKLVGKVFYTTNFSIR